MTSVAVNTYTHSVTYVADNILKSFKDIIRLSGLDPAKFVDDWECEHAGAQDVAGTGDLESVVLEVFNPKTDALIVRWDIDVVYGWSPATAVSGPTPSSSNTTSARPALRRARRQLRHPAAEQSPAAPTWTAGEGQPIRSTDGMVRHSLGSTIEHTASAAMPLTGGGPDADRRRSVPEIQEPPRTERSRAEKRVGFARTRFAII
jgi:hypothetical protein